jgi:hypothetical protein
MKMIMIGESVGKGNMAGVACYGILPDIIGKEKYENFQGQLKLPLCLNKYHAVKTYPVLN